MTHQDKSTPRPWLIECVEDGDAYITGCDWYGLARVHVEVDGEPSAEGKANAALIVTAVNLLDAHKACVEALRSFDAAHDRHIAHFGGKLPDGCDDPLSDAAIKAKAALDRLAKAQGGE